MAVLAVVVVIVVAVTLAFTGVIPLHGSASPSGTQTFSGSRATAQSAADGASGGPWSLLLVVGIATQSAYSGSASNLTEVAGSVTGSQCTFSGASGTPAPLQAPGVGNVSQGLAGAWVYMYTNSSGSVLLVSVISGSATVLGTISGAGCNLGSSGLATIPSSGIIDSTTATADAGAAGGWAFLAAHPQANATLLLIGGYSVLGTSIGATWAVEYLTCALSGAGPVSAPAFLAILSATNGGVIQSQATTVTCPSTSGNPPLSSSLALGTPAEAASGTSHWYNFTIEGASSGITWAETTLSIQSGGQTLATPSAVAKVISLTGQTLATYTFSSNTWSGLGVGTISSAEVLSLESPSELSGDTLVVEAAGSYAGTLPVNIP
ncbi:MAG TPA: hypothetical protein VN842_04405 [Thermoplasmata archaeon]|nr:hypothetical protein [Thermoplasmata archaeon]